MSNHFGIFTKIESDTLEIFKNIFDKGEQPELIISLNGGAKKMSTFNDKEINLLKKGILSVAEKLNTWIITAGFETGISALAGDLVRHHNLMHPTKKRKFKLIGILTYGKCIKEDQDCVMKAADAKFQKSDKQLDPNEILKIDEGVYGKKFKFEMKSKKILSEKNLNSKHDGFIFVHQNNVQSTHDHQMAFRIKFEKERSIKTIQNRKQNQQEDIGNLEVVQIVVNGGVNTIKTLVGVMDCIRSAIIIQGSGRAADLMSHIVKTYSNDNLPDTVKLDDKDISTHDLKLNEIINYKEKVHILPLNEMAASLGSYIIKTVFQNEKQIDWVKLVLFNAHTLARAHISTFPSEDRSNKKEKIENIILENNYWEFLDILISLRVISMDTMEKEEVKKYYRFQKCIKDQHFDMAKVIWKLSDSPLHWALKGSEICHNFKDQSKKGNKIDEDLKMKYLKAKREFVSMALGVLSESYYRDQDKTMDILKMKKDDNPTNIVDIASRNNEVEFMNHGSCQRYITSIWYGHIPSNVHWLKLICCTILFPLIFLWIFKMPTSTGKTKKWRSVELEELHQGDEEAGHAHEEEEKDHTCLEKICNFYTAPIVKFIMAVISYTVLLIIYTYVCLVELKPYTVAHPREFPCEIVVYFYMFCLLWEEIKQFVLSFLSKNWKLYFQSGWNIFDCIIFATFIAQIIARHLEERDFLSVRIMYGFNLALCYFRFLQFYYPIKVLGPKVIMVSKMFRDILFFLAIYTIVVLAYGTFAQNVLFSNRPFNWNLIKNIFYYPYWQTYGELSLDVLTGKDDVDGVKANSHWIVFLAFAAFMLISNILLLNLLIAMFGNTFAQIQNVSQQIWGFHRYNIITEYKQRSVFPAPFTFLDIIFIIKYNCCKKESHDTCDDSKFDKDDIIEFEKMCRDEYVLENNFLSTDSKASYKEILAYGFNDEQEKIDEVK